MIRFAFAVFSLGMQQAVVCSYGSDSTRQFQEPGV